MDSSQTLRTIRKLEREKLCESFSRVERRLEEVKMMYRNYKENFETLKHDAMSALNDSARWIERARRLHIEASEEKQREFRLRSYIKKLEREASQSGQQLKKDGGKLSNHRPQREKNSRTAAWGNASRTERILATCVTCVGSVLVYGLYQLSAPFLI